MGPTGSVITTRASPATDQITVVPEAGFVGTIQIDVNVQAASNPAGTDTQRVTIQVDPVVDLVTSVDATSLPASVVQGDGQVISLPVTVTNDGNGPAVDGRTIELKVFARPADATDSSSDVLLSTVTNQSISNLAVGASRTFIINAPLSALVGPGSYVLVASADSADVVPEIDESNNTVSTPANLAVTVEAEPPFMIADYFPLDIGIQWEYAGQVDGASGTVIIKTKAGAILNGKQTVILEQTAQVGGEQEIDNTYVSLDSDGSSNSPRGNHWRFR